MVKECILVVDDETRYLRLIRLNLEAEGYTVDCVTTGEEALTVLAEQVPDLVLLNVMLPGLDGFEVCARIRDMSTVPIIMLAANGADGGKVKWLRLGADDYIVGPFSAQELMARVDAILRRSHPPESIGSQTRFYSGALEINILTRRVKVSEQEVRLSPIEYRVLHCLASNVGKIVTQDDLISAVWGPEYKGGHDIVRVTVGRLCHKLGDDPRHPRFITTVPGAGYFLEGPP